MSPGSCGYVLTFRVHPDKKLRELFEEANGLDAVFSPRKVDDVEIVQEESSSTDAFAAYYVAANKNKDRPPAFGKDIALAVESLPTW
ncbi:hypothetical protein SDRG_03261 [Saprolegnia diclina VS20]|uniref:BBSome complex member BBS5 PH domain-containing protein n=1 Tax=Saprolegnia diclina (strain VS20) TaxID=1156394 RepID=T0S2A9_SAPDV|nr:hypothetical protein SDRG_03261 [Saprolegnia diclina VS20]EQC39053.1 hypothetical protein SDRG_03261 [Saprolegnia diclina VS20]|eukprot:XP_008607114.1 hypothetical protein SDRG_03261 [Saprolegnia diclina VS20]